MGLGVLTNQSKLIMKGFTTLTLIGLLSAQKPPLSEIFFLDLGIVIEPAKGSEAFSRIVDKPSKEVYDKRKPNKLDYPQNYPKYRFYGNNIKRMIDFAIEWDNHDLKEKLIFTIANHMKKCFLNWNKESVDDQVILDHLLDLSDGKLKVSESDLPLTDSVEFLKTRPKNNTYKSNNKSRKKPKRRY